MVMPLTVTRSRVLAALPTGLMSVVALVDFTAGPGVGLLPLVSLGPAFAGLAGGWRRSLRFGLAALTLCILLGFYNDQLDQRRGVTAMVAVTGVTVAAVVAAVMRERREEELASYRSIAEVAQRVLLRPVPRGARQLRVAVSYTSAMAEARIGGDLYEVVISPGGVRLIVGDVQGKGLEAVETAAVLLSAFREAAYDERDLMGVGERLERALNRELGAEKFVTAVLAEVGAEEGRITLLNYGHPAPLAVRTDGGGGMQFLRPPERALPLGLGLHETAPPRPYDALFTPGDQLLFYTDGVTEARDRGGEFYPLGDRTGLLKEPDADEALSRLRQDLIQFAEGPLQDDAAMLLLRYRESV